MEVELEPADLWNVEENEHLWVQHASTDHDISHEIRVIDVDRDEQNNGEAIVTITGTVLWDEREQTVEIETVRADHAATWENPACNTSFTTKPGVVEKIIRFTDPEADRSWDEHSNDVHNETVLSERESSVYVLKQRGLNHEQIRRILGVTKSSVDEYSSRIREKVELASNTAKLDVD